MEPGEPGSGVEVVPDPLTGWTVARKQSRKGGTTAGRPL